MTWELQSNLAASGIMWPAIRIHIPRMVHVIHHALGMNVSGLGITGRTKSWEAHDHYQQFGENESTDIGNSQRLRKGGNPIINRVLPMRLGLAKITEKVCISRHFACSETEVHIAENACCVDYIDTWLSKQVHWMPRSQNMNCVTTYYVCENTVEFDTGVGWVSLLIISFRQWVF